MTIMEKNSLLEKESRAPGMAIVDDNGRMTVFHPNAPEPVVPYWNPNLHSFRRSTGACERMVEAVKDATPALDLFEGFLMSNLPLGEDTRLKSEHGFWVGDGLCFQDEIKSVKVPEGHSVGNVSDGNHSSSEGIFLPAGEVIVRATGFLRQEGYFGNTDVPYEKMKQAIGDNEAMDALRKRYVRPKMEVTGYSPATCLLWIMDATKMDSGETIDSIGREAIGNIGVDSGTASVLTFEYIENDADYFELMDFENRDGRVFASSEDGYVASSATIGDGSYNMHPVYNANKEVIGYVVDFCSALYKKPKKKK